MARASPSTAVTNNLSLIAASLDGYFKQSSLQRRYLRVCAWASKCTLSGRRSTQYVAKADGQDCTEQSAHCRQGRSRRYSGFEAALFAVCCILPSANTFPGNRRRRDFNRAHLHTPSSTPDLAQSCQLASLHWLQPTAGAQLALSLYMQLACSSS